MGEGSGSAVWAGRAVCAALIGVIACVAGVGGCAAPQARTTRLQTRDFEDIAFEMAANLRASDFLRERTAESPPMTVAVSKVENLSTDLVSDGEKWFLMDRVIESASMKTLAREKAVRFVIPAEKLRALRETLGPDERIALERRPTHSMIAQLRSLTRAAGLDRTEVYSAFYRIVELESGEAVWSGDFALKRAAVGRSYN
ncbi:MAG: hypothetical protein SFZ24_09280 [Planctomycetota bacterium]|nr:hypothetical protein [Planctomycetota bacterium]